MDINQYLRCLPASSYMDIWMVLSHAKSINVTSEWTPLTRFRIEIIITIKNNVISVHSILHHLLSDLGWTLTDQSEEALRTINMTQSTATPTFFLMIPSEFIYIILSLSLFLFIPCSFPPSL